MWIFLNNAFFSVVQDKAKPKLLVCRARVKGDLEKLFPQYRVFTSEYTDYRYRCFITRDDLKDLLTKQVDDLDYENFKDSVKEKDRKKYYSEVWGVMWDWQDELYPSKLWQEYLDQRYGTVT